MTAGINLKCSSCDRPLMLDDHAFSAPSAIVCCRGCGKEFGKLHEIREAASILARAQSETTIEDLFADVPFLGGGRH